VTEAEALDAADLVERAKLYERANRLQRQSAFSHWFRSNLAEARKHTERLEARAGKIQAASAPQKPPQFRGVQSRPAAVVKRATPQMTQSEFNSIVRDARAYAARQARITEILRETRAEVARADAARAAQGRELDARMGLAPIKKAGAEHGIGVSTFGRLYT
jgi:hypothetical protein